MDSLRQQADEQARLWNGVGGQTWVELQDLIDRTYEPIQRLLIESMAARPGRHVLDVGCGTGSTTLAAARVLGAEGRCTGIDISQPMIAVARDRAERDRSAARFVCADAEGYPFEPGSVDRIISRFGVMFFGDPVRAFANLRQAATDDARVHCVVWRSPGENPFMTTAERAAAPLLPAIPARQPDAPGQFAFADRDRVRRILEDSGWSAITIEPVDVACAFPESELVRYITRLGPVGRVLSESNDDTRARVLDTVRPAFDPFVHDDEVRFTAACWMLSASTLRQA
jgi:SAM-dependent methyltransferase